MFCIGDKVELLGLSVIAVDQNKVTLETHSGTRFEVPIEDIFRPPERIELRVPSLRGGGSGRDDLPTADDALGIG